MPIKAKAIALKDVKAIQDAGQLAFTVPEVIKSALKYILPAESGAVPPPPPREG